MSTQLTEFKQPTVDFGRLGEIQVEHRKWEKENFGGSNIQWSLRGIAEEYGELSHAVLKHEQKIRGMEDDSKFIAAVDDALADIGIYGLSLASAIYEDVTTLRQLPVKEGYDEWVRYVDLGKACSRLPRLTDVNAFNKQIYLSSLFCELAAYAQCTGTEFMEIIETVWAKVRKRNWSLSSDKPDLHAGS